MAINVSFVKLEMVREPAHRYNLKTRTIHGPEDADQAAREILRLDRQAQEVFAIFMLDTKNNIMAVHEVTRGSINASIVHPREVFKAAVMANATSIICFHNHPREIRIPAVKTCLSRIDWSKPAASSISQSLIMSSSASLAHLSASKNAA